MRTAQANEMKELWTEVLDAVKNGETVQIREGEKPVAELSPPVQAISRDTSPSPDWFIEEPPKFGGRVASQPDQTALKAHIDELVRQGKAHKGTGKLPDDFFTRPRPKLEGGSVLDQLLRDREEGW